MSQIEQTTSNLKKRNDYVDINNLVRLEDELNELENKKGISRKHNFIITIIDKTINCYHEKPVNRKNYIKLALLCGWFCGAHKFYNGHIWAGLGYLAFCWTGIPFAMTLIDLMIALPKQADQNGIIII